MADVVVRVTREVLGRALLKVKGKDESARILGEMKAGRLTIVFMIKFPSYDVRAMSCKPGDESAREAVHLFTIDARTGVVR